MRKPVKVLYIIDKAGLGGATNHLSGVLLALDRQRFAPSCCFLLSGGPNEERLRAAGVPASILGLQKIYGWRALRAFVRLVRWIRRERFSVVHTYLFSANLFGVLAARLAGVPVIIASRREVVTWMRWHHRWATRLANRYCSAITVNSQAVYDSVMAAEHPNPRQVVVIPNGVDTLRFAATSDVTAQRLALQIVGDGPVVMTVGHLSPIKGPQHLIEAAPAIVRQVPSATFVLVGDGPMRRFLEERAVALGLADRVIFCGRRRDVPALLAAADVVVAPSESEGCSNAILEAMAMGRAIVATRAGGNAEAISDGVNGVLVPPRDPAALARATVRLLQDDAARRRLGDQARRMAAERFDHATMVRRIERLYEERLGVSSQSVPTNGRLGCIVSQFPRYDEAFILRELTELARGPQELAIFSLRPCRDRVMHDQANALLPRTVYAPFVWSADVWGSHLHFLRRAPGKYLSALGWAVSRHWRHPVILLKTLAFFPKTVHFARLAQERGVTQLHAFWATYPASAAVIMQRLTGIPYSLSGHAHDIHTTNPALAEKMRGARFTLTCTETNKTFLETLCNGRPRIVVNYHGVDVARFAPEPKRENGICHILAVGSLLPCKGFETLIEACRDLQERALPFHCTIAGGGPLEQTLRRSVERHGLTTQIEFTGYVTQDAVAKLYQQAHLCVLPLVSNIHWGIPNVLIEAMATKTAVVTCQLPSLRELVEPGVTGWVMPQESARELAHAIEYLWTNHDLRHRLAQAGYERVMRRFALEETGERLRGLFSNGHQQERS